MLQIYKQIKPEIDQRYLTFKTIWKLGGQEVFSELVFCLCTPQTNAKCGWKAVQYLTKSNLLNIPDQYLIQQELSAAGVRFNKNKAKYIAQAINQYSNIKDIVENKTTEIGVVETRNWLANTINGLGMKEASHFLRNVGFGDEICILDRHILRNLVANKVIPEIPKHMNKKAYLEIESKMIDFAHKVNIPVFALDFVFWYNAKGELFK